MRARQGTGGYSSEHMYVHMVGKAEVTGTNRPVPADRRPSAELVAKAGKDGGDANCGERGRKLGLVPLLCKFG